MNGLHSASQQLLPWLHERRAAILALVLTGPGLPYFISYPNWIQLTAIHCVSLYFPLLFVLRSYSRERDILNPVTVAAISFCAFHVIMNPLALGSESALASRGLHLAPSSDLGATALHMYAVNLVSWFAFLGGVLALREKVKPLSAGTPTKTLGPHAECTSTYLLIGLAFIAIGIAGNVGCIGGIGLYLRKVVSFYERWEIYEDRMLGTGMTKWVIAQRFLPVGIFVLVYGHSLRHGYTGRRLLINLLAASIANLLLNSATGQRSATLAVFIYSAIAYHHAVKRVSLHRLAIICSTILAVAIVYGSLRNAAPMGETVRFSTLEDIGETLEHFSIHYLTNTPGTLSLVSEVETDGTVYGATAFAGVTGLLGGPTPLTTQAELSIRKFGMDFMRNPRYGAPGELYFNFGWTGLALGSFLIGGFVALLGRAYQRCAGQISIHACMVSVFTVINAFYILVSNLNYIPPDLTYYSVPFYLVLLIFHPMKGRSQQDWNSIASRPFPYRPNPQTDPPLAG